MPDYLITCTIPTATVEIQTISEKEPTKIPAEKPAVRVRIVRAKNEAQALRHVVADTITIGRATLDDAIRVGKIETAAE